MAALSHHDAGFAVKIPGLDADADHLLLVEVDPWLSRTVVHEARLAASSLRRIGC